MNGTIENIGIVPALQEINRVWSIVNYTYFNSSLPDPVFTIQSRGRKKGVLGWCTTYKAWTDIKDRDNSRFEINIVAEALSLPVEEIFAVVLHEIAHYVNWYNGVRDCIPASQYHNKHFKERAESLGLIVEKKDGDRRGWAYTKLGDKAREFLKSCYIDENAFKFARVEESSATVTKQPTRMKKWECACGTKIRAAVDLNVTCNVCGYKFVKKD